jgi:biopolymer transport protein ExbD
MLSRSFVDVLFILLLGTMVMLSRSVQVGAVDTELLRLGHGAVSPVRSEDIRLLVVGETSLQLEDHDVTGVDELVPWIRPEDAVLLVARGADVPHQRVMAVWSELRAADLNVALGAEPEPGRPERE